jgi:hypothetical protein
MKRSWIPCALAASACAATSPPVPAVRFVNTPPVAVVNDRLDVPKQPASRAFYENLYHYDAVLQRRIVRALELAPPRRALGVNAYDEVPDSTWFTNRIGTHELSTEQLVVGPLTLDSPELHKPWTIKSTKSGTSDFGFLVTDARGEKFMIKFDAPGFAEQETATHVIVGRLLWACGFNVTEDFIVHLTGDDLVVAPDATISDELGDKHPLTRAEIDRRLATLDRDADGRLRAMASRWLDGKTLGGHPSEGVRRDDPNDRIPHELRRDLRGAYSIFEWVDHVDVQESNFVDAWVKDRANPKLHYVRHYLIDFGKSLGVMATTGLDPRRGHAYVIDFADMARSLAEVGLVERSWEPRRTPRLRGVGLFDAATYDPGAWKNDYPVYAPFLRADRLDKFWGAKILIRFTRDQLHAVVETGQLSDPRAVEYVTDTLVARQRATAAYWFARVNPLDHFALTAGQLCFDDLALVYGFSPATTTSYRATGYTRDAQAFGGAALRPDAAGHACVPVALAAQADGYTMIRIETFRPDFHRATIVHLARAPISNEPRVIGIWRE